MRTAFRIMVFVIVGCSVISGFADKKETAKRAERIAGVIIDDNEIKDTKEDFRENLSELKEEVGGVPWAGVIVLGLMSGAFLLFVLMTLGKMAWILIVSPLVTFLLYFILFTAGLGAPGNEHWIDGLFSPLRLFSGSGEWIGLVSWVLGGLIAGLFIRDTFKGILSAGVIALISWGWKVFPSNGVDLILNSKYNECYRLMSRGDLKELAIIGIILGIAAIVGSIPGSRNSGSRKRRRPVR